MQFYHLDELLVLSSACTPVSQVFQEWDEPECRGTGSFVWQALDEKKQMRGFNRKGILVMI